MGKWIALVVLLAATVAISHDWQEGSVKRDLKLRSDGVIDYNEYIGSQVVNSATMTKLIGCQNKIVKKFANNSTVDTVVFSGCPQANAFWMVVAMDSLDGSVTLADVATAETNGDTLFIKRQAVTGALRGYCAVRVH